MNPNLTPADLPRVSDRNPFLYLEHCTISRKNGGILATDKEGETLLPVAATATIMLGPGVRITHDAVTLITTTGASIQWVGEHGVRCYANAEGLATGTRLLERQAAFASSPRTRLMIARRMYAIRFPDQDMNGLTMHQMLGKEGQRIQDAYQTQAARVGITWTGRRYSDEDDGTPINQALSTANSCLYGAVTTVIQALGCSPALGFIHAHHRRAFAYDIADLYKTETTIPIAFDLYDQQPTDVNRLARRRTRDLIADTRLLERCAKDITRILDDPIDDNGDMLIWNGGNKFRKTGHDYSRP